MKYEYSIVNLAGRKDSEREVNLELRKRLDKLLSFDNYMALFETYCVLGEEEADKLFWKQVREIFPEYPEEPNEYINPNWYKMFINKRIND